LIKKKFVTGQKESLAKQILDMEPSEDESVPTINDPDDDKEEEDDDDEEGEEEQEEEENEE